MRQRSWPRTLAGEFEEVSFSGSLFVDISEDKIYSLFGRFIVREAMDRFLLHFTLGPLFKMLVQERLESPLDTVTEPKNGTLALWGE